MQKHFAGTKHLFESGKTSVRRDQSEFNQSVFSSHFQGECTPGWVKEARQTVTSFFFLGKHTCLTTVHASRPFGISVSTTRRETSCYPKKKKSQHHRGAVGTSTRAVACAFASQPQPLLCGHPSVPSDGQKNLLTDCGETSTATICP